MAEDGGKGSRCLDPMSETEAGGEAQGHAVPTLIVQDSWHETPH